MIKKKKIGIIDADLIGRKNHKFPNLVCEKISAYWKEKGAVVELLLDYDHLNNFDEIYISKVFTDTPIPDKFMEIDKLPKHIHVGGTGFFFDKAPNLPDEIEHHMPDYSLYDSWLDLKIAEAEEKAKLQNREFNLKRFMSRYREYREYSIGFLTRGCFRKCDFCVNKKYNHVFASSALNEFYDPARKKICLLDDNFFGFPGWKALFGELLETGKQFKFKQGLDERLLNEEKCKMLFNSKYDGDFTFAFDNVKDYEIIYEKLQLITKYRGKKSIKFYVLVGFDSIDATDIINAFVRIDLLLKYRCLPYIMRFQNKNETPWKTSKYRSLYVAIARWCNQPNIIKKMSFRQFCVANQKIKTNKTTKCSCLLAMENFAEEYPEVAAKYFDIRMEDYINGELKDKGK